SQGIGHPPQVVGQVEDVGPGVAVDVGQFGAVQGDVAGRACIGHPLGGGVVGIGDDVLRGLGARHLGELVTAVVGVLPLVAVGIGRGGDEAVGGRGPIAIGKGAAFWAGD